MSRTNRKPLEFFKFFWRDFNRDTAHLTRAQRDGYLQIICAYYDNHGPLHENAVMKASGATSEEWAVERNIIAAFFVVSTSGYWTHKRIENELKTVRETTKKRAKSGRAGGVAKSKNVASAKQVLSKSLATKDVYSDFGSLNAENDKKPSAFAPVQLDQKTVAAMDVLLAKEQCKVDIDEAVAKAQRKIAEAQS